LSENQIAFVCRSSLNALAFLHFNHYIHRDIKAANILLNHNGNVKLADYGCSTQIITSGKQTQCVKLLLTFFKLNM
jgi:serine/threonine protein kinase